MIFDVKNKKKKQGFDLVDFTKSVHDQDDNSVELQNKDQFKEMKMDAVDPF